MVILTQISKNASANENWRCDQCELGYWDFVHYYACTSLCKINDIQVESNEN